MRTHERFCLFVCGFLCGVRCEKKNGMRVALLVLAALLLLSSCAFAVYKCPSPGVPEFSCPSLTQPGPAADVRHLKPGNIKAVMALGDSVTAGFAMVGVEPLEFRGDVYSTGGNEGARTLANYLKHYSPDLTGDCQGVTIPLTKKGKGLNVAVSEGQVQDLSDQIDVLVKLLKSSEYVHVMDEWKLLTLFIGANNLCICCDPNKDNGRVDYYESHLVDALNKVRQEIPKVFVNLVGIFNISQVWDSAQGNIYCQNIVPLFDECPCLNANVTDRNFMDAQGQRFNEVTNKVAKQFADLQDPQFTVSAQPGVQDLFFADLPIAEDFLSDVDCFHPSLCADQAFSVALWNNMFQPVGKKSTTLDPINIPHQYCPTDSDYIQ